MLISLLKVLLFVVVVIGLAYGVEQVMGLDGSAIITFGGLELTLGPLEALIGAALLCLAIWLFIKTISFLIAFVRFLNGDETAMTRYFNRSRERKGLEALSDGLMALASGEGQTALQKAEKANRYLERPEMTNLLAAQAAEMTGNRKKAEETYRKLLENPRTRFVGIRGIMKQKLADGDTDTALKLAEKAFALKPKHVEVQDTLLKLQADRADWQGARKTLGAKLKSGALPRDVHRRRDAVLAISQARDVMAEGATIEAREAAIEANRLSPDLVPAALMAARSYIDQGKAKYAARVIKGAWESQPHPELATAFAEIEPNETPEERIKRFQTLIRHNIDDAETKMLMAELHIAAEQFPEARRALGDLPTEHPTARNLAIMAAVERGEGADDAIVRGWLTKALTAPRGPQWVCDNCAQIHGNWDPICSNCGSFDTLAWRAPPAGEIAMPASTEMLPLIVGKPAPLAPPEDEMPPMADAVPIIPPAEAPDETGPAEVEETPEPEIAAEQPPAPEDAEVIEAERDERKSA